MTVERVEHPGNVKVKREYVDVVSAFDIATSRIPDTEESGEALADRVLRDARVFITPGFIFGRNGDRYIRISLCAPEEKLREAAARITKMNK